MKIAITGHRPHKLGNDYNLTSPLVLWIKEQLQTIINDKKPTEMISGMALGIDTLWALLAIENNIPLLAAIPCDNQEKIWPHKSQKLYYQILDNKLCRKYIVCPGPYSPDKMIHRDKYMVNNADILVAVYDGSYGGTGHTYKYAQSIEREIIRINPKDFIL